MPKPTAAQALFGHLPSAERPEVEQRRAPNVSGAMWPSLSREGKANEAARTEQLRRKQAFIADLRELRERIRSGR
jgi:hypothetical protein